MLLTLGAKLSPWGLLHHDSGDSIHFSPVLDFCFLYPVSSSSLVYAYILGEASSSSSLRQGGGAQEKILEILLPGTLFDPHFDSLVRYLVFFNVTKFRKTFDIIKRDRSYMEKSINIFLNVSIHTLNSKDQCLLLFFKMS